MKKILLFINMTVAFFIYPFFKKKFKKKEIWLIGGNAGELYADNGKAMFEYLNLKGEEVYWIINKNSPVCSEIPGKFLYRGSIKSYLYFMNSKAVLFSHSISADIVPYLFVVPFIKKFHYKTVKVFLNHGTAGLKKRQPMNPRLEKIVEQLITSYDINTADAEYEKDIKHNDWKIENSKIYITGSPRYDIIEDKSFGNKIFFMPTWRSWIGSEKIPFEKTDYFKNITGLIKDIGLQEFLKNNNIHMTVYIHQLMHKYFENFDENIKEHNIKLLPKEADIRNEIMTGSMLITDYSSMAFDFFYLNKPILFFQFDRKKYEKLIGSYINLENELFGEAAFDIKDCTNKIKETYLNGFKVSDRYNQLRNKYFKYTDQNNRERLYKIIKEEVIRNR